MNDHLPLTVLNGLVDDELSPDQLAGVQRHLAECHACTSIALQQSLLKSATAKAGQRFTPSSEFAESLARQLRVGPPRQPENNNSFKLDPQAAFRSKGWAAACVFLLAFAAILFFQGYNGMQARSESASAALAAEVYDRHIAVLVANAPLQVLSSDRHTVKPWFQGKLPFSFNLPADLPSDTSLDGANLAYIDGQPTAQLMFSIGKHRASVLLLQRKGDQAPVRLPAAHSGFHLETSIAANLEIIAVSDVERIRLQDLVRRIVQAQNMDSVPSP